MSEEENATDVAEAIASAAASGDLTVIAAESVTAGSVAQALAAAPGASDWFAGSLVTYTDSTKRRILGVEVDDVFTAECATQMAAGALRASGATVAVAITGVAGPDPEDGHDVGQVFIAVGRSDSLEVFEHSFSGDAADIVDAAKTQALRHLRDALR